jgi:hypothetical protein
MFENVMMVSIVLGPDRMIDVVMPFSEKYGRASPKLKRG